MPRIHHGKRINMHELVLDHALVRLAQHRLGIVDADDAVGGRIIRERNAGADADVEDAPADALGRRDRGLAAGVEHRAEDEIVDRRPTRIGLRDRADIDFVRHRPRHFNSNQLVARLLGVYARLRGLWSEAECGTRAPDFASLHRSYDNRLAPATRASRTGITCAAATALWMKPPPSTRACPLPAS